MSLNKISIIVLSLFAFLPLFAGKSNSITAKSNYKRIVYIESSKKERSKKERSKKKLLVDTTNLGTWRNIAPKKIVKKTRLILDKDATKRTVKFYLGKTREMPQENRPNLLEEVKTTKLPWGQKKRNGTFSNIMWTNPTKRTNEPSKELSLTIINKGAIVITKNQLGDILHISSPAK